MLYWYTLEEVAWKLCLARSIGVIYKYISGVRSNRILLSLHHPFRIGRKCLIQQNCATAFLSNFSTWLQSTCLKGKDFFNFQGTRESWINSCFSPFKFLSVPLQHTVLEHCKRCFKTSGLSAYMVLWVALLTSDFWLQESKTIFNL